MNEFKVSALKELTEQQTRYAPPARRQEQVARAERLMTELDSARLVDVRARIPALAHRRTIPPVERVR